MALESTKQQIPRGTLSDAETADKIYLFKKVSGLHATYQIRLQTVRAIQEDRTLVIVVPKECKIHKDLQELIDLSCQTILIEKSQ
jgi:hypothetical protein